MVDRCLLPVLTAHALAVILAFLLNTLRISQVSSWTLFFWFTSITLATLWFYHNLQVGSPLCAQGMKRKPRFLVIAVQSDQRGMGVESGIPPMTCMPYPGQEEAQGGHKKVRDALHPICRRARGRGQKGCAGRLCSTPMTLLFFLHLPLQLKVPWRGGGEVIKGDRVPYVMAYSAPTVLTYLGILPSLYQIWSKGWDTGEQDCILMNSSHHAMCPPGDGGRQGGAGDGCGQ